jgi:hypothetical protein
VCEGAGVEVADGLAVVSPWTSTNVVPRIGLDLRAFAITELSMTLVDDNNNVLNFIEREIDHWN